MFGLVDSPRKPQEVSGPIAVDCPTCNAAPGERCLSVAGNPKGPHTSRSTRAFRMRAGLVDEQPTQNEELTEEGAVDG